jgi:glycosyltransferase involved in cell wall biosynthesis
MNEAHPDLRVLVVHNRYRSALPSGENAVVHREVELLREAGVAVSTWIRSSDEIASMSVLEKATLPLRPIWSHRDTRAVATIIEREHPQILHLHNPYPLVSPAVIRTAKRRGLTVVQSVHNYRHSCANGLHFRAGEVCTLCLGRRVALPAVRHACYRDSRPQSALLATAEAIHHPTWKLVDRYLALSEFMAAQLAMAGIPPGRVVVRPNFVDDPGPPTAPGAGFLFAGRLEAAKGILLLLDAWERSGLDGVAPLVIAGDGPLRDVVEERARRFRSVEVTGHLGRDDLAERFRSCAAVVVPSISYEGPPTVLLEGLSHARPVVATRVGGIPEALPTGSGWLAEPDPGDLASALVVAHGAPNASRAARSVFEDRHHPDRARERLLDLYRDLLG